MTLIDILLAIFLPPIAVLMRYGVSGTFFLNILLTMLGGIPGMIHAFIVLSRPRV